MGVNTTQAQHTHNETKTINNNKQKVYKKGQAKIGRQGLDITRRVAGSRRNRQGLRSHWRGRWGHKSQRTPVTTAPPPPLVTAGEAITCPAVGGTNPRWRARSAGIIPVTQSLVTSGACRRCFVVVTPMGLKSMGACTPQPRQAHPITRAAGALVVTREWVIQRCGGPTPAPHHHPRMHERHACHPPRVRRVAPPPENHRQPPVARHPQGVTNPPR